MATSSIFLNVEISDPQKVDRFLDALEESEKAVANKTHTAQAIPMLQDPSGIRRLMEKRKMAR